MAASDSGGTTVSDESSEGFDGVGDEVSSTSLGSTVEGESGVSTTGFGGGASVDVCGGVGTISTGAGTVSVGSGVITIGGSVTSAGTSGVGIGWVIVSSVFGCVTVGGDGGVDVKSVRG